MSLTLTATAETTWRPHPEGIHPAVCVDVIDLGTMTTEWQGQSKTTHKIKLVFESAEKADDGRNCTVSKSFTASLHPKAKLAEFLGKWRGKPVLPGESIDLAKLIGACCTLVVSHQQNMVGKTYASIDAVSKPTKKLAPSGGYDPAAARQRIEEWKAKQTGQATPAPAARPAHDASAAAPESAPAPAAAAAPQNAGPNMGYDPEVGF